MLSSQRTQNNCRSGSQDQTGKDHVPGFYESHNEDGYNATQQKTAVVGWVNGHGGAGA